MAANANTRNLRLDLLLVERGLAESRSKAQALIMSGKVHGPDRRLDKPGQELVIDIEIFHSNIEGEVVNCLYSAHDAGDVDACLINPAGWTTSSGVLRAAIAQVRFPVIEVHASNPTSRGTVSTIQPVSKGSVYGFGYYGYYLALEGLKDQLSA